MKPNTGAKRGSIVKSLIWFCIGFFSATVILLIGYWLINTHVSIKERYDLLDVIGTGATITTTIGTLLAVIVALFKEHFLKWLYSPKLHIELVDNGISENISENTSIPTASSFSSFINIHNNGSLTAIGCKAYISDIQFSKNGKNVFKSVKGHKKTQLLWEAKELDIPAGITSKIKLFDIINPNSSGTPQAQGNESPAFIKFNGCNLKEQQNKKGVWKVDYFISCRNSDITKFSVQIDWDGTFKSRSVDMEETINITLNRL